MLCSQGIIALVGILGSCVMSWRSFSARKPVLEVGHMAPAFTCVDSEGIRGNSRELIGKQTLVVYFYSGDFDFCSTRQAVHYQEQLRELSNTDVTVVGISGDQVATHRLFKAANRTALPGSDI
jgi:thioredoxin-dependent peroxiredoxin